MILFAEFGASRREGWQTSTVTHYATLGVEPGADGLAIRRSYLAMARRHHPDRFVGDPVKQSRAEERMREINAAWAVLSDPARRKRYDLTIEEPRPQTTWQPLHPDEPDVDPEPWDFDDTPIAVQPTPQWLTVLPALLVLGGGVLGVLGALVGIGAIVVLGLMVVGTGALGFLIAPLHAMSASRRADQLTDRSR